MTKSATLLLALLLSAANARAADSEAPVRELLQISNQAFSEAFAAEDLAAVKSHYVDDAVLMPEHSMARYGKDAIEDYYRQWFGGAKIGSLRKTPYETLDYGDYAIETGAFVQVRTMCGWCRHRGPQLLPARRVRREIAPVRPGRPGRWQCRDPADAATRAARR